MNGVASHAPRGPSHTPRARDSESGVLKRYYQDNVLSMSAQGVLKVSSIILSLVSSIAQLTSGSCAGAPRVLAGAAITSLVAAAVLAVLFSGAALSITNYAPTGWLFTDIIITSVLGVAVLLSAVLSMALCHLERAVDYVHGPLAILNSGTMIASAVVAYVAVTRRWDAARRAGRLRPPPSAEQDA